MNLRIAIAILLSALLGASGVSAQAPDVVAQAKGHVEKAEAHYRLAEFPAAIEEFKAAYRLVPRPGILFNLGQCYMQTRDYAKAEFSYRAYLRELPEAENKELVEELITQAAAAVAREDEARIEAAAPPPSPWLASGLTAASIGGGVAAAALLGIVVVEVLFAIDVASPRARTGLFWSEKALGAATVMGLGVAMIGGAIATTSTIVE